MDSRCCRAGGAVGDDVVILQGDCLSVLRTLDACSVQTCVTSPPYFGLRDYGVEGQIGLEETPEAYVDKLVAVFREVRRVLKDDGTLWLNLGDSYANSPAGNKTWGDGVGSNKHYQESGIHSKVRRSFGDGVKQKDLLGIPWQVAFALRADGWYLRSEIIWHKPNPMPESVRDRPTKAHEQIFLLSKSPQYFYDADAVREPLSETTRNDPRIEDMGRKYSGKGSVHEEHGDKSNGSMRAWSLNPAGRNRRTVWTVTTKPYKEAHFATFPPDLIEPCILAGTSERGECPVCGRAWARVVETKRGGPSTIDERQKLAGGEMETMTATTAAQNLRDRIS